MSGPYFPPPGNFGNSSYQWIVRSPGQPDQVVDYSALSQWVRSGQVDSNFVVYDMTANTPIALSSIPGLFSDKEHTTALIFTWLLGGLGIDRFYLGYTGLGIAKLLLGWMTCGIWWLIDAILITMRNVPDAQGRRLR